MHSDQCRVVILTRNVLKWLIKRIETEDNERCLTSLRLTYLI